MAIEELQEQVRARYAVPGLPAWPAPRDPMTAPLEEEYSRVTDPGRYRVVHERARAWAEALATLPGVVVSDLVPGEVTLPEHQGPVTRGVRVTSDRPGTLPLLLLEREVDVDGTGTAGPITVLHVALADPAVELATHPDCGCDACDTGSEDLLEAIDVAVAQVVDGPIVALEGTGWSARWHRDGGSSGGRPGGPEHERVMAWCARLAAGEDVPLPDGTRSWVGQAWLA